MSSKDSIIVEAPAKVNLYLEVIGRRGDGYHDIRSIMVPVSLFDTLRIEPTDDSTIETVTTLAPILEELDGDWSKDSDNNLATVAARILKDETGYKGGARIFLEKNIPVGGGLGGGSADAAAILKGLNRAWDLGLDRERLMELGVRLGSDVPGLVHGGAVVLEGMGERVSVLDTNGLSEYWMVLANPRFAISTKDIYTKYNRHLTSAPIPFSSICSYLQAGDIERLSGSLFNGLQETVFVKYPLVEIVAEDLCKAGALGVLVSGSGASVFGLARDEKHAHEVAERVGNGSGSQAWTRAVRTLL